MSHTRPSTLFVLGLFSNKLGKGFLLHSGAVHTVKMYKITVFRLPVESPTRNFTLLRHATQGIIGFRTSLISFLSYVGLGQNHNSKIVS